ISLIRNIALRMTLYLGLRRQTTHLFALDATVAEKCCGRKRPLATVWQRKNAESLLVKLDRMYVYFVTRFVLQHNVGFRTAGLKRVFAFLGSRNKTRQVFTVNDDIEIRVHPGFFSEKRIDTPTAIEADVDRRSFH